MTPVSTPEQALARLTELGYDVDARVGDVRRIEVGFRVLASPSNRLGSSDLVVTADGRVLRVPSALPDTAVSSLMSDPGAD